MKQTAALLVVGGAFLLLAGASEARPNAEVRWQQFVRLPGVLDVAGPRGDGRLVVAAGTGLYLLNRSGLLAPYTRGASGYLPARGETYIALARARRVPGAGCSFRRDDVYALDPADHPGITMIDLAGKARRFAELPPGSFLSSIAYDSVGRFGYRLLVTAIVSGRTTLYAIDCRGRLRVIVRGAARVEGGSDVAPAGFGRFAGRLIAADELSGRIYAFGAGGHVQLVARPRVPAGSDIGVESVGFIPVGLKRTDAAFMADLGAPGSPTMGSDSLLRLTVGRLFRAGAGAGDLLVATEASGVTLVVRCRKRCSVRRIGRALDATHAEGHIAFGAP